MFKYNLGRNEIGDAAAKKLADALPKSQIHTLNLDNNKISGQMQQLLKQAHPNINWSF